MRHLNLYSFTILISVCHPENLVGCLAIASAFCLGQQRTPMMSSTNFNGSSKPWVNLDNYSKYFNVATEDVNYCPPIFIQELAGRIDCYGPLWVSITLAIAIFVTNSTIMLMSSPTQFDILSSLTSSLFYILFYLASVCIGGWAILRWMGAEGVYLTELLCLIGYSLGLNLPVVVVSILGINTITWIVTLMAASVSAVFVYQNLHPALRASSVGVEKAHLYSILFVFIHIIFTLSLKIVFLY